MKNILLIIPLLIAWASVGVCQDKLKIVTTLSSYADIAQTIGGDLVETSSIASPRFNPHFIEAKPSDVLKLKRATLFIHSGLDLEAWRGPLVDAAARAEIRAGGSAQLDLSTGITILEKPQGQVSRAEGDIHIYGNPHYWIDPRNGAIIAQEIGAKLEEIDPAHAAIYKTNADQFLAKLNSKIAEWQKEVVSLKDKEVIGYHNEWVYLMKFLGMHMGQFLEPKPGIPPTPKQIEVLTDYAKQHDIKGIVQATFYPDDAAKNLAQRTGAKVLLLCQNVGELPQASDYISMIDYNINQIRSAYQL
jgi:ABC-type Zn uptake system ZnuABC Zn-binding protein ZnuA